MKAFLQLEKGDINNLEGKVIIYSRLLSKPSDSEESFLGLYASCNPVDFKEKFGEGVEETVIEQIEEIKSMYPKEEIGDNHIFLASPIEINKSELRLAQEDVVYAGEFLNFEQCKIILMNSVEIYMVNYDKQRVIKGGLNGINESKNPGLDSMLQNLETYLDIESEKKQGYIQDNYIAPVMHSIEIQDFCAAKLLAQDFVRFSKKSPLIDDAYGIAAVLNSNEFSKRNILLQFYFEKVLAIVSERFEDAAKIRDKIKSFK
jgi:hypothetical protein